MAAVPSSIYGKYCKQYKHIQIPLKVSKQVKQTKNSNEKVMLNVFKIYLSYN